MDVTGIIWHLRDGDETEVVFLFLVHHHRKGSDFHPATWVSCISADWREGGGGGGSKDDYFCPSWVLSRVYWRLGVDWST